MKAKEFYNNIFDLTLEGTCCELGKFIQDLIENHCVKANYNKIIKLIKRYNYNLYNDLALNFYNPWCRDTYRSKDGKFIIITHSMTEYLFKIN